MESPESLIQAARQLQQSPSRLADRVRILLELSEPLAAIIAGTQLHGGVRLLSVRVVGPAPDLDGTQALRARPSMPPELRRHGEAVECHTSIEVHEINGSLVGDVVFVWCSDRPEASSPT